MPSYLIDDQTELDPTWLEGKEAVLVTAGTSAPEHLVNELIERLKRDYGGVVETHTLVEEDISFELPKSARSLVVLR